MQRTSKEMYPLVEAFYAYEGTKKSFCQQHKINNYTFDYWRIKYEEENREKSAKKPLFQQIKLSPSPQSKPQGYTIQFASGHQMNLPAETPVTILMAVIDKIA